MDGDRWLTIAAPQQDDVQLLLQPPDWFEGKEYYREEVEQYHDLVGRRARRVTLFRATRRGIAFNIVEYMFKGRIRE